MRAPFVIPLMLIVATGTLRGQARASLDSAATIVTSGTGTIRLPPESAVIHFAVHTRAQTAAAATSANARSVQSLMAVLQAQKAPEESLVVAGFSVRANQNYQTGVLRNYEASAELRISV